MKITYAKDPAALLRGVDTLLVVAPHGRLARFPNVLPTNVHALIGRLRKDASPGDRGAVASTLTGGKPRRLAAGALPDKVSRHNSPARAESVQHVVGTGKVGGPGRYAVLFLLEHEAHAAPTFNAMAKALPLFSARTSKQAPGTLRVLAIDRNGDVVRATPAIRALVAATREVSRLVDTPPTEMNPEAMVREARRLLKGISGVRTSVIVGPNLLQKKLFGIHAVGRTAMKAPRLFVATFTPRRPSGKRVALVGKGITYDTGGLSIKGRAAMLSMKADMGGSAAALGAFKVLVQSGCRHRLTLLLCLAENAVGPNSYKPDDILTMHSGKTVEINNTDAEGRLVLADGVSYAARVLRADTILDAATLTGAQCVATGNVHASIISNSAKLEKLVVDASYRSGDLTHPLMFAPELYRREFKSSVADMKNSVRNRSNAQVSCAAQFIWWHIDDTGVDWCHVDLAGPAFIGDRATGYGVALLAEAVRAL